MEDLNYKQARALADNEGMYGDFLANRNLATSGAESFAETSKARWQKLREENDKRLRTEGGFRPSRAAIDEANRTGDEMGSQYYRNGLNFEANARDKKAVDDASLNIQKMQAAAAEYGTLDTASIEMEKALETAKLALPIEEYTALEKTAKAGMAATVGAYLNRLQDRAVSAGSDQERQSFETEAFSHVDAAIARGYMDAADGVEAKRQWKENYQKRDFPTLDPTERERIARGALDQTNIKDQLFNKESGGNYANDTNSLGYMGGFQFGAPRLSELELYTPGATENLKSWKDTGKNAPGKWSGTFNIPGFPDVRTVQDFLKNPEAQDKAWEIHDAKMNDDIARLGLDAFVGQTIDGIPVTIDGIKAAIHLGGAAGAEKFFKTSTPAGAGATATPADTEFLLSRLAPGHDKEHITKMDAPLQGGIAALFRAAPPEIAAGLGIMSGTRTTARQQELWEEAERKHGKGQKWVAKPGHSQHEFGNAADLTYNGQRLDKAPKEVRDWVHANAGRFGMHFRMAHEPWHIETAGALQSSTDPADNNGTTMSSYLRMGSNSPSYFDSMPQDQMLIALHQSQIELANQAAANARQWSDMQAARKGELSLAILTGSITSGQTILDDDILEDGDKATLYRSYQEGMEKGAVLRDNTAAYNRGEFSVNPFDPAQTKSGDDLYESLTKGQDAAAQGVTAGKFASDTGYVPKRVMAQFQNGRASSQAGTVQTAMTDAERLLQVAPIAFDASEDGRSIRDSVAEWKALQDHRGMDPQQAAQAMIQRRDIEQQTGPAADKAADDAIKAQTDNMGPAHAAVFGGSLTGAVTSDPFFDPTFSLDQQAAFQDDWTEIYREKFLTSAKMDPAIAFEQTTAEVQALWGRTGLTGEDRVMRHPPEKTYPAIGGTHDYIVRSFNHFRAFEDIPEGATEVQLISTDITSQDKRNNHPARYMVGWFKTEEKTGQRIWEMSPNWFFVGPKEMANAAAVEQSRKETRHRAAQQPQEEIADIMKLPPDERAAELNRRRFGGDRQDYIDEARRIEALNRPGRSLEERDAAAAARGAGAPDDPARRAQIEQQTLGGAEPSIEERMNVGMEEPTPATLEERMNPVVPPASPEERMNVVTAPSMEVAQKTALVAGLGKKAAKRLVGGGSWEEVVEGIIEHAEIGGSSEQAAERNEAHDLQLEGIGIDPRSERRSSPGNMAKLARGILDLKNRMRKAGVSQETQDGIISMVRQTAAEMMRKRR